MTKIVKLISTADTSAEWFAPPFPLLNGSELLVPASTMAQKVALMIGDRRGLLIEGQRYLVSRGQVGDYGGRFDLIEGPIGE